MSSEAIEGYLYLFWTRIHETQAPCIHRASFKWVRKQRSWNRMLTFDAVPKPRMCL